MKDDSAMFRQLQKAAKTGGINYRGVIPKLAERWGRTTRTVYSYSAGVYPLPAELWDDMKAILAVFGVQVKGRSTDGLRPKESPSTFVKKLRREYNARRKAASKRAYQRRTRRASPAADSADTGTDD